MRLESLLLCLLAGTFPAIYIEASDRNCRSELRSRSRRNMRAEEDEKAALQDEMNIQKKVIDEMISRKLIIGGTPGGAWPMFALVLMGMGRNTRLDEINDFCGGALVADNMVITAAHCVKRSRDAPKPTYVALGVICRSEGILCEHPLPPIDLIEIDEFIVHPEYEGDFGKSKKNDIALIKLRRRFDDQGGKLSTMKVDRWNYLEDKGSDQKLWIYGFGDTIKSTKRTKFATAGQYLQLSYMSRDRCDVRYKEATQEKFPDGIFDYTPLEDKCFCGENTVNNGICSNDSGGPVTVKIDGHKNRLLVGVVNSGGSYTVPCAHNGYKDKFASVYKHYDDFIRPNVCKHIYEGDKCNDSNSNTVYLYDGPSYMSCTCADVNGAGDPTSCMSGQTGMFKVSHHLAEDDQNQQERNQLRQGTSKKKETKIEVTELKDLDIGDFIQGFDEQLQPATCKVEAVGQFGYGTLYGNFTHDHFIYNPTTKMMEEHGIIVRDETEITTEDKYDILTDCPLGVDESGNKFASIDSGFCGNQEELSWSDYILLHRAILRVVRESGPFWFSGSTYPDDYLLGEHSPKICETMLLCMKDHDNCHHFEQASVHFIENVLSSSARDKALRAFKNVGRHRELGSVAAVISDGKSVRG